jgi:uncharacterized protein YecE (DUF72 family)
VVPGTKVAFPDAFKNSSRLCYYSSLFNTVEINSTFKKIPLPSTFAKWVAEVNETFLFTIKLWREITHLKKLAFDAENIDAFIQSAGYLGSKKGCLLVQFPGSITQEFSNQVEQILERLQQLDHDNEWQKAVEFRSTTWYISETYEMLKEYNASMVFQDMPKSRNLEVNTKSPLAYFRFHGPTGDYRGSYSREFLSEQAEKIKASLATGKDVYAYFNNTMGSAYDNAVSLKALLDH